MWVWLKLKVTPRRDFWLVSVGAFLVNFFMHSTKQYQNGWLSIPNTLSETKIYAPKRKDEHPRQPPRPPPPPPRGVKLGFVNAAKVCPLEELPLYYRQISHTLIDKHIQKAPIKYNKLMKDIHLISKQRVTRITGRNRKKFFIWHPNAGQ